MKHTSKPQLNERAEHELASLYASTRRFAEGMLEGVLTPESQEDRVRHVAAFMVEVFDFVDAIDHQIGYTPAIQVYAQTGRDAARSLSAETQPNDHI